MKKIVKRILLAVVIILVIAILVGWILFNRTFYNHQSYEAKDSLTAAISNEKTEGFDENRNAYFGDLHIHTSWSFDAFIYNVRATPHDAYLYAKGHRIPHVSGDSIQINRPLDFMAVTDHAEYMGVMIQMLDPESPFADIDIAKRVNNPDESISRKAFGTIGLSIAVNKPYRSLIDEEVMYDTWKKIVKAADDHYDPGKFTTFPAYEWTSSIGQIFTIPQYAYNMHRNVIFKGGKVPGMPFSSFHSQDPEDLWKWLDEQRGQGIDVLAIPHNANISNGNMYGTTTFDGSPMDDEYVKARMRNEPINEVVQIKGQSMAHPSLAGNDEFADFEMYEYLFARGDERPQGVAKGSYVRDALKDGLSIQQSIGRNPYKFGFIGSSDSHNAATNTEEDNQIGKSGLQDPTPKERLAKTSTAARLRENSVAGIAGVWAKENTRESIFSALERKETFATSGPRIQVRFFGGWKYGDSILQQENWIETAYSDGVHMGGDLNQSEHQDSPVFIISALKDPDGANLDRVQVIKGWIDEDGASHEKIFDVSWSGDRAMMDGGISPVGSTVDLSSATYTNDIGAISLSTVWKDPEFDERTSSFYYLRVLEIPTPRWTTYDAARMGVDVPDNVMSTIQERAWSSPIWYNSK